MALPKCEPDPIDPDDCLFERPDPDAPQTGCPRPARERLKRIFDRPRDGVDDEGFIPDYKKHTKRIWLQRGEECTGFALAAIANYHIRKRAAADPYRSEPEPPSVSARMLYEMAQDNDGKPAKEGSTLRGALKGWRKVGVVTEDEWPYHPDDEHGQRHGRLTVRRVLRALEHPGGAYFAVRRENVAGMQDALNRGYPLYVGLTIHTGWYRLYLPGSDYTIYKEPGDKEKGGHACVIAGYDAEGFWVHNSWGQQWGDDGYGRLTYDDWLAHGCNAWVVVPEENPELPQSKVRVPKRPADKQESYDDMWRHLVVVGDDGRLLETGRNHRSPPDAATPGERQDDLYAMDAKSVQTLLFMFKQHTKRWQGKRRLAVFADGGYWPLEETIERLRPLKALMLANQVYPIFVLWETPWFAETQAWLWRRKLFLETLGADQQADQPTGIAEIDAMWAVETKKEVMDSFAPRAWRELARRAEKACARDTRDAEAVESLADPARPGAARILAETIAKSWGLVKRAERDRYEIHLIGHGAGDMTLSRFARALAEAAWAEMQGRIGSATLWAPATTVQWFHENWAPLLDAGLLERMTVFALDDHAERADSVGPVLRSILYLVADVLAHKWDRTSRASAVLQEADGREVWVCPPKPVLGMERYLFDEQFGHPLLDRRLVPVTPGVPGSYHADMVVDAELQRATVTAITGSQVRVPPMVDDAPETTPELYDLGGAAMPAAADARREPHRDAAALRSAWQHALCNEDEMTSLKIQGAEVVVHDDAKEAFRALHRVMQEHRYEVRAAECGGFACKRIIGSSSYSLHAYGLAADYNWSANALGYGHTDMPDAMVAAILGIRTNQGHPVFQWGGHSSPPDPEHFEVMATPDELRAGIDEKTYPGRADPAPGDHEVRTGPIPEWGRAE